MNFVLDIDPPTCTAQEKRIAVIHGRPMMYDTPAIKEAKKLLCSELEKFAPAQPMEGPVLLAVTWSFRRGKSHKHDTWRTTRPDTDNLQKILKDCMTKCGYWGDDSQVVYEICKKKWSDEPCMVIDAIEIDDVEDFKWENYTKNI